MKKHKNGFTLSEVLITLMIIGIISAMTIPSIIQNTNKQELHAKFKKNYSTISNALKLAQVQEGMIGDNRAVFMPSDSGTRNYDTAKKFSKYLNTVKVCKNKNDTGCSDIYYDISYATAKEGVWNVNYPAIVLSDGSIYKILQFENCSAVMESDVNDADGNAIVDEEGNTTSLEWTRNFCAYIYLDVNGAKKPNKFAEDVFCLRVASDDILFANWAPYGYRAEIYKILTNSK